MDQSWDTVHSTFSSCVTFIGCAWKFPGETPWGGEHRHSSKQIRPHKHKAASSVSSRLLREKEVSYFATAGLFQHIFWTENSMIKIIIYLRVIWPLNFNFALLLDFMSEWARSVQAQIFKQRKGRKHK